jgi:phage repressor protein C with HTH and peptisase S24 domain
MGWADRAIIELKAGRTVVIHPHGNSMTGKVNNGDTVTLEPIGNRQLQKDDIVLCRVKGQQYLHLVKAVQGERYLIGNNRGGTNGWIGLNAIYGIAINVER